MKTYRGNKGDRFGAVAIAKLDTALRQGEGLEIDRWHGHTFGRAGAVRSQLAVAASVVLREEGCFPLPEHILETRTSLHGEGELTQNVSP